MNKFISLISVFAVVVMFNSVKVEHAIAQVMVSPKTTKGKSNYRNPRQKTQAPAPTYKGLMKPRGDNKSQNYRRPQNKASSRTKGKNSFVRQKKEEQRDYRRPVNRKNVDKKKPKSIKKLSQKQIKQQQKLAEQVAKYRQKQSPKKMMQGQKNYRLNKQQKEFEKKFNAK